MTGATSVEAGTAAEVIEYVYRRPWCAAALHRGSIIITVPNENCNAAKVMSLLIRAKGGIRLSVGVLQSTGDRPHFPPMHASVPDLETCLPTGARLAQL